MPPEQDAITLAVVVARLDDLRDDIRELHDARSEVVPRGEWLMRNAHVDATLSGQGREIGDLRAEMRARRLPWPAVVAVVLSAVALATDIVPRLVG